MNDLLYFNYNGKDFSLKQAINSSNDNLDSELIAFQEFINKLNLKYSYYNLFRLSDEELMQMPFSLVYKNEKIHIADYVKDYNELSTKLLLPEIHSLELRNSSKNSISNTKEDALIIFIETSRLFQDLYNTFSAAKFALLESAMKLPSSNKMPWNNPCVSQFWFRAMHLNNAIIWYNSSFDILLQCIWIGKQYFLQCKKGDNEMVRYSLNDIIKDWESFQVRHKEAQDQNNLCYDMSSIGINKERNEILRKCNISKFSHLPGYKKLLAFRNNHNVAQWANILKHRTGLRYLETYTTGNLATINRNYNYNSQESLGLISIDDVIKDLEVYHVQFVNFINEIYSDIKTEFNNNNIQFD